MGAKKNSDENSSVSIVKAVGFGVLSFVIITMICLGGPFKAVAAFVNPNRFLPLTIWLPCVLVTLVICAGCFLLYQRKVKITVVPKVMMPSIMIVEFVVLLTITLAVMTNSVREAEIVKLAPDQLDKKSFWHSLHSSPRELQFFLHAAAIKDCVPYVWSCRKMKFYELSPNIAVNVFANEWLVECNIKRTR